MPLVIVPPGWYAAGMEKRKRQPDVTRARILEIAGGDFVRSGYAASGLGGIVERAGLTKGALFHHFADKRTLGLAWVSEVAANGIRVGWVDPMADLVSLEGLKEFCRARLTTMSADDALAGLVLMAAEMGGVDEAMAAAKQAIEAIYGVKVVDVKTQVRRERDRTYKYGKVAGKTWKRAMVRVAAGQKIELF